MPPGGAPGRYRPLSVDTSGGQPQRSRMRGNSRDGRVCAVFAIVFTGARIRTPHTLRRRFTRSSSTRPTAVPAMGVLQVSEGFCSGRREPQSGPSFRVQSDSGFPSPFRYFMHQDFGGLQAADPRGNCCQRRRRCHYLELPPSRSESLPLASQYEPAALFSKRSPQCGSPVLFSA